MLNIKYSHQFNTKYGGRCYLLFLAFLLIPSFVLSCFRDVIPDVLFIYLQLSISYLFVAIFLFMSKVLYPDLYFDGDIFDVNRSDTFDVLNVILAFVAMLCTYFISFFISMVFSILLPNSVSNTNIEYMNMLSNINPLLVWFLLAVLPATVEEFFFRGFLYNVTRRRSFLFSMFVTTFSFSLIHFNVVQAVYTLILGFVLFIIRDITKSIYPCLVFHLFFNSMSVFSMYKDKLSNSNIEVVIPEKPVGILKSEFIFAAVMCGASIIALILVIIWFIKYNNYKLDKNVDKKQPGLTLSYIIAYVLCCLFIIISI